MTNTQQKGLSTEMHCILDFTQLGYCCLRPLDATAKYDVVVDINGTFIKIQCKTASFIDETNKAFKIKTCCQTMNTKTITRYKYSSQEVDYFYTWIDGQGYLVSINEAIGVTFTWRYNYPSSTPDYRIHIAKQYKMEDVIKGLYPKPNVVNSKLVAEISERKIC